MSIDLLATCKHCGKPAGHHQAKNQACPMGRRSRTHGYPFYSRQTKFESKTKEGRNG